MPERAVTGVQHRGDITGANTVPSQGPEKRGLKLKKKILYF